MKKPLNPSNGRRTWHALDTQAVFEHLDSRPEGLEEADANQRLDRYGANRLPPPKRRTPLMRLLAQFHNVLIYVLLGAGVITALLQHLVDAGVIIGVVVINGLIGFIQEGKAEKAIDAVRNMLSAQATVIRADQRYQLPSESLVPGDVVFVQSGDRVPADLRLFRVKELRIDEAMLTGESVAVGKNTEPTWEDAALGDRRCLAFSGTLVTYGQGAGVVVETGPRSELGRISAVLGHVITLTTPLMRQLASFARWLTGAILIVAVATVAFGTLIRGYPLGEMFLAAVGLAVAAIPEGLPAVITIALAIGVQRMARRNAIIRRLPAVETLGSVSVICSDKTGTLTRNEMTVQTVITANDTVQVSGVGYDPHGGFRVDGQDLLSDTRPELKELCRAGVSCNDASLVQKDGFWHIQGDPTEGALVVLGTFELFLWERQHGSDIETARTVAVNTLVIAEVFYLFNTRYLTASAFSRNGLLGNPYVLMAVMAVVVFQLLFTYLPIMQHVFTTASIGPEAWLRILAVGILVFLAVETEKAVVRRRAGPD